MTAEYKYKNAVVRIHGQVDEERLKKATEEFLKKVIQKKLNK